MRRPDPATRLMARAQRGERGAFDELVRSFHRGIYAFARRSLGDDEQAQEVTQETFVRAFRYRASYSPDAGSVRGWLFAIAANRIREARRPRAGRAEPVSDLGRIPDGRESALEIYERGVAREEVQRALEALPDDARRVLALKYLSDLSYGEVAQALGISVSAAKMRAMRARDLLTRRLAEQTGNEARR